MTLTKACELCPEEVGIQTADDGQGNVIRSLAVGNKTTVCYYGGH